jgi:hypothetical protein
MVVVVTEAIGAVPTIPDDDERLEKAETVGVPIRTVDVRVNVVVEPPGIVLVNVVKMVDVKREKELGVWNVDVKLIELGGILEPVNVILLARLGRLLGAAAGGALSEPREDGLPMVVVKELVIIVVRPPETVPVVVNSIVVVVIDGETLVGCGGCWVKVVVIDLIRVVVWPPGTTLVRVVTVVDVMTEGNIGGVLGGVEGDKVEDGDGANGDTLRNDNAEELVVTAVWLVGRLGIEGVPLNAVVVGVISGVLVIKVLKALGGAMLFIH